MARGTRLIPVAPPLLLRVALFAGCVLVLSCNSTRDARESGPTPPGTLRGRVVLTGPLPEPAPAIVLREDMRRSSGLGEIPDERWVLGPDRGVGNVLVTLEPRGETERRPLRPTEGAVLGKVGPRFVPRLLAVTEGTTLEVRNVDSPCKCFHSFARKNPAFNRATPAGESFTVRLDSAERIEVRSDLRPYMAATIAVVDTPHFAVTGPDGTFAIEGLPPGRYRVELWHGEAGRVRGRELEVPAAGAAPVELHLSVGGQRGSR